MHNIALAVPLEEKELSTLKTWAKSFDWSEVKEIHFLHVVKRVITPLEFNFVEIPDTESFKEMQPELESLLENISKEIIPPNSSLHSYFHVEAAFDPEEQTVELLKAINPDFVVSVTQNKKGFEGFFHHSFTEHLIKFAPCDVYVVRPR